MFSVRQLSCGGAKHYSGSNETIYEENAVDTQRVNDFDSKMTIAMFTKTGFDGLASVVAEGFSKLINVDLVINNPTYQQADLSMSFGRVLVGEQFKDFAAEADLVIYCCRQEKNRDKYLEQLNLAQSLNRWEQSIYVDGHDKYNRIQKDFLKCQRYFRREKKIGHSYPANVLALPMAICDRYYLPAQLEREIVFSCMARTPQNLNHIVARRRNPYLEMLNQNFANNANLFIGTIFGGANKKRSKWSGNRECGNYYEKLANSKASISLYGAGFDTLRYWEILASGACLFSQPVEQEIEIPNAFVPGEHYVAFNTPDELRDQIRTYLKNPDKLKEIQSNAFNWAKKHHTAISRAYQILSSV